VQASKHDRVHRKSDPRKDWAIPGGNVSATKQRKRRVDGLPIGFQWTISSLEKPFIYDPDIARMLQESMQDKTGTEDWWIEQERNELGATFYEQLGVRYRHSMAAQRSFGLQPNVDQIYIDLVRWRAVRQAHHKGQTWNKSYRTASRQLAICGQPFAGSLWAMRSSYKKMQRVRKSGGPSSRDIEGVGLNFFS
jgi:hypothetical protein